MLKKLSHKDKDKLDRNNLNFKRLVLSARLSAKWDFRLMELEQIFEPTKNIKNRLREENKEYGEYNS